MTIYIDTNDMELTNRIFCSTFVLLERKGTSMVAPDTSFMDRQASKSAGIFSNLTSNQSHCGSWVAGSGCEHSTKIETVEQFQILNDRIYILVHLGRSVWVGTNQDLIDDQASRQRFQIALRSASHVHSLLAPADPTRRLCMTFDLDTGVERNKRSAA